MAESSGFFNAHLVDGEYDRVYLAEHFAKYFASFIGNGIFGGKSSELIVHQKDIADMSVKVLPGQAWIDGYWYENDDELSLTIDAADGTLNRIDLIIVRWDKNERVIRIKVQKGTSSSNPTAPILQRGSDFYDLKLCEIYVKAGATKITQADITDTRLNSKVCGFVTSLVEQFDTEEFGIQLNSFIEQFEASNELKMQGVFDRINALIDSDLATRLTLDVDNLKKISIESEDYKGCYYRIFENTVEWINPPAQYGVEYRTTERWQDKPVFQKTFYIASLPDSTFMSIGTNTTWDTVISIIGYAIDSDNLTYYPFPVIVDKSIVPVAAISAVESDGYMVIYTTDDMRSLQAYVTLKYTKS